jgi:hypothetical protein
MAVFLVVVPCSVTTENLKSGLGFYIEDTWWLCNSAAFLLCVRSLCMFQFCSLLSGLVNFSSVGR